MRALHFSSTCQWKCTTWCR